MANMEYMGYNHMRVVYVQLSWHTQQENSEDSFKTATGTEQRLFNEKHGDG